MGQTTYQPPAAKINSKPPLVSVHRFKYYWGKTALLALLIITAWGLWGSVNFLVFKYPQLEQQLSDHAVSAADVTDVAVSGIITLLGTFLTMMMAWQLHKKGEEAHSTIELIGATLIIAAAPFAKSYLESLPWIGLIQSLF